MLAEVGSRTKDVFTVNVALVAPAGIVTLEGTLAAPLLLDSVIRAPPTGAGLLSVTVPDEDCKAPKMLEGFSESEARVGGGAAGVMVSDAVFVTPLCEAVITAVVEAATALVPTTNVALVVPAATVTLAAT
jgi:hypothetical protein